MRLLALFTALTIVPALTACSSPSSGTADPRPPATAVGASVAPAVPPTPPPAPRGTQTARGDLAPCPGINPDIRRPAGSNCLGIVPAACGADRVATFAGQIDSPALRADITRRAGHNRIRWIADGEPVTEDLRPDRLNIQFDKARRIAVTDCY